MSDKKNDWERSITDDAPSAPGEVRALYDNFASTYDRAVESWGYSAPDVVAELLARSVGLTDTQMGSHRVALDALVVDIDRDNATQLPAHIDPNLPILDAGCGTGLTGAALARRGFTRITGSDLSADSLALARQSNHYETLIELDLNQPLPFNRSAFAGVICAGVFSYIPDVRPVLREFMRLLQPGGTLVFTQREDHFTQYDSANRFDQLYDEGGFDRLVETTPQPYLPGNPSFADNIGVHYFVWRKRTATGTDHKG